MTADPRERTTRFVVIGAGAIGGAVGGHLARAGHEVALLARGRHLDAIRADGLAIETPAERFVVRCEAGERVAWRAGDVALLATKTQDADAALRDHAVPADVPIVCLTNGIEAERIALRHASSVYGVYVMIPATYLEPGVVQVWAAPAPGLLDLGAYPERDDPRAEQLAAALRSAGFASTVHPDIMRWKRGKLLSNLANGAEALAGPEARRSVLMTLLRAEALACYAAAGLPCISEAEEASRRTGYTATPIAGRRRTGGSTWQSLARGAAALETDYLNGEIVLLGRLHGVATPVNEHLQHLAADAARTGVTPGSIALDALIALVTGAR